MVRGRWVLIAAAVVLAGLVAGAVALVRQQGKRRPAADSAPRQEAPAPADVSLPARIQAQQVVTVSAPLGGTVEEFFTDVGQEVYEGQLLARISNSGLDSARESAAAAVQNAQARIAKLESAIIAARLEASRARADAQRAQIQADRLGRIWVRQKMLLGEGATPRLVYEKSEKEAVSAKAESDGLDTLARQSEERVDAMGTELENAKKLLDDKMKQAEDAQEHAKAGEVRAPVNGIVLARKGEVGKVLGENGNAELFQIAVNPELLQAVVEAHPSALARLQPGQNAVLFFADIPGEGIAGTIAEIKDGQALINFTSPSPMIKPGMTAQVRLTLR